jgi:hypothetical protein
VHAVHLAFRVRARATAANHACGAGIGTSDASDSALSCFRGSAEPSVAPRALYNNPNATQPRTCVAPLRPMSKAAAPLRWPLATLLFVVAITAIAGGGALVGAPRGTLMHADLALLAHSPFSTFLVPGLLLLGVIGIGHLVAAVLVVRRSRVANHAAFAAGIALLVWIVAELALIRAFQFLQLVYLALAVAIVTIALRRAFTAKATRHVGCKASRAPADLSHSGFVRGGA